MTGRDVWRVVQQILYYSVAVPVMFTASFLYWLLIGFSAKGKRTRRGRRR
jgi:hypothetical protein